MKQKRGKQFSKIMKTTENSRFIEPDEILQYLFKIQFNLQLVIEKYSGKKKESSMTKHLKQQLKELIIAMEADLFRHNKINSLRLFQCWNEKISQCLLEMKEFFNCEQIGQLYEYYKWRFNFVLKNRYGYQGATLNTINQIKKLQIYLKFMDYLKKKGCFQSPFESQQQDVFIPEPKKPQLDQNKFEGQNLYRLYQKYGADHQSISYAYEKLTMPSIKLSKPLVRRKLDDLAINGIYEIYKMVGFSEGYVGYSWDEFFKRTRKILRHLPKSEERLLMRVGVEKNASMEELSCLCKILKIKMPPGCQPRKQEPYSTQQKIQEEDEKLAAKAVKQEMKEMFQPKDDEMQYGKFN